MMKIAIGRKMDGLFTDHDTQDPNPNPRQFLSDIPPLDGAYHSLDDDHDHELLEELDGDTAPLLRP